MQVENLLSAIVDSSDDAIVSKDLDGIITSWNRGAERLFGYSAAEIVGRPVTLLIPENHEGEEPQILERLKRGERIDHYETVRVRKDGRLIDVSLTISPVKNRTGVITGASKIARDITLQKRAEAALLASEARFRQLADFMPHMVWTAQPDGQTDYYNERWYEYTGNKIASFGAWSHESLVHPEDLEQTRKAWVESIELGKPYLVQHRLKDAKGRWRWFLARALPAHDDTGAITKWFGAYTDIDDQKRIERELRQANQDLEQFAFSASHDLQEPLRTIKIYSELLAARSSSKLDPDSLRFLDVLMAGAKRMQSLVRDLLAYTQIRKPVAPECSAARNALDGALGNLEASITSSGATVLVGPLPSLPVHPSHLGVLFQNLIGNAIKYRDASRPPVVRITATPDGGGWLFAVQDNGIGIPLEYTKHVFGLFKRLHVGSDQSGTGLGLAICQRIVDSYQGRIWVESQPGQGSTFFFILPA